MEILYICLAYKVISIASLIKQSIEYKLQE